MNSTADTNARALELMFVFLDGSLEREGVDELTRYILADPAICKQAAEMILYDVYMREIFLEEAARLSSQPSRNASFLDRCAAVASQMGLGLRRRWRWAVAVPLTAAVGLLAVLLARPAQSLGQPHIQSI